MSQRFILTAVAAMALATTPALADGSYTQLYAFTGGADGAFPKAMVTLDAAGNIYGEAEAGGVPCSGLTRGCGTVYKLDPSGQLTTIVTFGGINGESPIGKPLLVGNTLYGSAAGGGKNNAVSCGLIFSVNTDGSNFTDLHDFKGTDGCSPEGALILAPGGKAIYGVTGGGAHGRTQFNPGNGVVFQLNIGGHLAVLHAFAGPEGANPNALLMDKSGTLYGSASFGGVNNGGVIYSLVPKSGVFVTLHDFTGKHDGSFPELGSIDRNGVLYGATDTGSTRQSIFGSLFTLTPGTGSYAYKRLFQFYQGPMGGSDVNPSGPALLPTGQLVGNASSGPYLYDPLIAHDGVAPFVSDLFAGETPALTTGAVIGAGEFGGISNGNLCPYGCGVIYRWSLVSP